MSLKTLSMAALIAVLPLAATADIMIMDSYARASSPAAKAGAAFMVLHNMGAEDDRLIGASTEASKMTQLHTHIDDGNGIMKMTHVEEGFEIKAGEKLILQRGGHHVMMMGLTSSLDQGETISVTLTFEKAGEKVVEIPVDLERKPAAHNH
jgi:copper(I)-binding protein